MDLKKRSAYFCFMLFLSIILWVIFGKHGIRKKKASINQLNDIIEVPQNLLEKYGHELQLSTSRPELDPKDQLRQLKKFLLVKIVPNFFPPLQTRDQTMANIEQIKKKEKLPDNFQRIWILHSILDTDFSERIWAQVFTDGEMTAMVPNPFENSKNVSKPISPDHITYLPFAVLGFRSIFFLLKCVFAHFCSHMILIIV